MIYQDVVNLVKQGETVAFAQVVRKKGSAPRGPGAKMVVRSYGSIIGTIGGGPLEHQVIQAALRCISDKKNMLLSYDLRGQSIGNLNMQCGGVVDIYIEVIMPNPTLLIIGAGHVGQSLARLASELEWKIILVDERKDLISELDITDRISTVWSETYVQAINTLTITRDTAIVIVTKDSDLAVLRQVVASSAFYIGMMGSKNKIEYVRRELMAEGTSENALNSINTPIGIPIKAETPAEIAVSILAAIIAERHTATELAPQVGGQHE